MDRLIEVRETILRLYARYSKIVDKGVQFILALATFMFISSNIGFMKISANPMVILGLAVICTFLPITATVVVAVALTVVQFYALSVGVAAYYRSAVNRNSHYLSKMLCYNLRLIISTKSLFLTMQRNRNNHLYLPLPYQSAIDSNHLFRIKLSVNTSVFIFELIYRHTDRHLVYPDTSSLII